MKLRLRKAVGKVLLVAATAVSVLGFRFTGSPFFIMLPFLAGVTLVALVATAPGYDASEGDRRVKARRRGLVQLLVSCAMVTGFMIYSVATARWGEFLGYSVMLATLGLFALIALVGYRRAIKQFNSCDELRGATGIYGHEQGRDDGGCSEDGDGGVPP